MLYILHCVHRCNVYTNYTSIIQAGFIITICIVILTLKESEIFSWALDTGPNRSALLSAPSSDKKTGALRT